MKDLYRSIITTVFCFLCGIMAAQDKKIERADLPAPVQETVTREGSGATILGFSMEKEHGKVLYEVHLQVNDHSKDISMEANGSIAEVEEEVAIDALPPVVKDALQAKAGAGKLMKVESLTKHDKVVAYEAQVMTGKKKLEIQVGPEGQRLGHEE